MDTISSTATAPAQNKPQTQQLVAKLCRACSMAVVLLAANAAAPSSEAASITPPNLVSATSASNADLMLIWPSASVGPLEAISWATLKAQLVADLNGTWLKGSNNLADLGNPTIARANLGLGSAALANTGTSGTVLCVLSASCTWTAQQLITLSSSGAEVIPIALKNAAGTLAANGVTIDLDATGNGVGVRSSQIAAIQDVTSSNGSSLHLRTNPASAGAADALVLSSTKDATFFGHLSASGAVPILTTCGTATVTGNDVRGIVNITAGTPVSCTINFARAYANPPICVVSPDTGGTSILLSINGIAANAFNVNFSAASNMVFTYICEG